MFEPKRDLKFFPNKSEGENFNLDPLESNLENLELEDEIFQDLENHLNLKLSLSTETDPSTLEELAHTTQDQEIAMALIGNPSLEDTHKEHLFTQIILPRYNYRVEEAFLDLNNPGIRSYILDHYNHLNLDLTMYESSYIDPIDIAEHLRTPSLRYAHLIPLSIFIDENLRNAELINSLLLISRYLDSHQQSPTLSNCLTAWEELKNLRNNPEIRNRTLFTNRQVILLANNEENQEGGRRFGQLSTLDAISSQNPSSFNSYRSPSLTQLPFEEEVLNNIANSPENLTFFFDGHGNEREMYYTDEEAISVGELYYAMVERYNNLGEAVSQDIYIFDGCRHSNFIQTLINLLIEESIPLPTFIGHAEQSLPGVGNENNHLAGDPNLSFAPQGTPEFNSVFIKDTLGLGGTENSNLGHFIDHESNNPNTNPILIIPTGRSTYLQIA